MRNYYISRDVESIVTRWCSAMEFVPPAPELFAKWLQRLTKCLEKCFKDEFEYKERLDANAGAETTVVNVVRYEEMRKYIAKRYALGPKMLASTFWISLDCVYAPEQGSKKDADFHIQVTRVFEADGGKKLGTATRPSFPHAPTKTPFGAVETQVRACEEAFNAAARERTITDVRLVDDGLFTGGTLIGIMDKLLKRNIPLNYVCFGLATSDGMASLSKEIGRHAADVKMKPIALKPGEICDSTQLRDWVCERDFYFGVPYGGRTAGFLNNLVPHASLREGSGQSGGLFYAVGSTNNLIDCASVSHGAFDLTRVAMQNSYELWKAIESRNEKIIRERFGAPELPLKAIPRIPYPLSIDDSDCDQSFTAWLNKGLEWFGRSNSAELRTKTN